jgi:hypothetical protein
VLQVRRRERSRRENGGPVRQPARFEYRRFLEPADYDLLVLLDANTVHAGNDDRTRKLLYNLSLLEYNDGTWRRSHPVIRTLEGYALARERAQVASAKADCA